MKATIRKQAVQDGFGEPGECILYYKAQDVKMNEFLIQQQGNEELDFEEQALIRERNLVRLRR